MPMSAKQFEEHLTRLGLSQVRAGHFLGVHPRTVRHWVAGDSAVPEMAAKLFKLMVRKRVTPEQFER